MPLYKIIDCQCIQAKKKRRSVPSAASPSGAFGRPVLPAAIRDWRWKFFYEFVTLRDNCSYGRDLNKSRDADHYQNHPPNHYPHDHHMTIMKTILPITILILMTIIWPSWQISSQSISPWPWTDNSRYGRDSTESRGRSSWRQAVMYNFFNR